MAKSKMAKRDFAVHAVLGVATGLRLRHQLRGARRKLSRISIFLSTNAPFPQPCALIRRTAQTDIHQGFIACMQANADAGFVATRAAQRRTLERMF
jgi:hypothetical protein